MGKNDFNEFDVRVTYVLLLGATSLDIIAFFTLVFSDETLLLSEMETMSQDLGRPKAAWPMLSAVVLFSRAQGGKNVMRSIRTAESSMSCWKHPSCFAGGLALSQDTA